MKKVRHAAALFLLTLACAPAGSLDWKLPVVTMRYEAAGGQSEDPDDQTLQPSSLRGTLTLQVKESADPLDMGLLVRTSLKDYYLQSGDYSYVQVVQDAALRLGDSWKLGLNLGLKSLTYPEPDSLGLSKDSLALDCGGSVEWKIAPGTSLEGGISARFTLAENTQDSSQAATVSAGLSTRLGEWLLGARYRGELRSPLGADSTITSGAYHTGAVSVQWDPNR
jgi:hypothetical protein